MRRPEEWLGVPALAAHLFVFYPAILSAIMPPVCGAIFIAAGIAEADWVNTAKFSLTLGFAVFLLPFLFAYDTSLLLIGSPLSVIMSVARATLALALLSAGSIGFLNSVLGISHRVALILAGLLILMSDLLGNVLGILIALCVSHLSRRTGSSISLTIVR